MNIDIIKPDFVPDYKGAILRPSPNFDNRKAGALVKFIILHYTDMASAEEAEQRLESQESKVSAHYVVREDGAVVQMVREAERAWHAGEGAFKGISDINSYSIGIEIANSGEVGGFPDFPEKQIEAVIALCQSIIKRHNIAAQYILGHSDIAPHRKIDPGEKFPWAKLYKNNIGHFVEQSPIQGDAIMHMGVTGQPVAAFQSMLGLYGYEIDITGEYDERTIAVTKAFQRHFRPAKIDGLADMSTISTLQRLLSALPSLD